MTGGRIRAGRRAASLAAAVLLGLGSLAGCASPSDLSFTQDERITIVEPGSMATVDNTLEVRWQVAPGAQGLPPEDGRQWALVINEYPPPVGGSLADWLQAKVPACRGNTGCLGADGRQPNPQVLRDHGVYLAPDGTSIMVEELRALPSGAAQAGADVRFWTLVILDADGKRSEESMWYGSVVVEGAP